MSFQSSYNKSANRDIEFTPKEPDVSEQIIEEERRKWLLLTITRDFILFLGRRELELLNSARNAAKIDFQNEAIIKNLIKATAYRELIDYLVERKLPNKE